MAEISSLRGADMRGADLDEANLWGADMRGTQCDLSLNALIAWGALVY